MARPALLAALVLAALALAAPVVVAQPFPGRGIGMGGGMGMRGGMGMMGGGGMGMGRGRGDPPGPVIMSLLASHKSIQRQVTHTPEGITSLTESADPQVAAWIKQHVAQMSAVLASCEAGECSHRPHFWDPLFAAIYDNAKDLDLQEQRGGGNADSWRLRMRPTAQFTATAKGVKVTETGKTDFAKALVRAHADVVSRFVAHGHDEAMSAHEVPKAAAAVARAATEKATN